MKKKIKVQTFSLGDFKLDGKTFGSYKLDEFNLGGATVSSHKMNKLTRVEMPEWAYWDLSKVRFSRLSDKL